MNLYLISQEENNDWDTFDSAVVCAANEEDARTTDPYPAFKPTPLMYGVDKRYWCDPKYVQVKLIGKADQSTEAGVVCASYNAG
jgi:hypothetical protein